MNAEHTSLLPLMWSYKTASLIRKTYTSSCLARSGWCNDMVSEHCSITLPRENHFITVNMCQDTVQRRESWCQLFIGVHVAWTELIYEYLFKIIIGEKTSYTQGDFPLRALTEDFFMALRLKSF
jgi:hypothetical protein